MKKCIENQHVASSIVNCWWWLLLLLYTNCLFKTHLPNKAQTVIPTIIIINQFWFCCYLPYFKWCYGLCVIIIFQPHLPSFHWHFWHLCEAWGRHDCVSCLMSKAGSMGGAGLDAVPVQVTCPLPCLLPHVVGRWSFPDQDRKSVDTFRLWTRITSDDALSALSLSVWRALPQDLHIISKEFWMGFIGTGRKSSMLPDDMLIWVRATRIGRIRYVLMSMSKSAFRHGHARTRTYYSSTPVPAGYPSPFYFTATNF